MSLRRIFEVLAVSTATLAQGSRDVDLSRNASDWKQLNITKGNNTFQLAYSMSFPEGHEDLEQYASCADDAIKKTVTSLKVEDEDVNTTQLTCNTTAFFTPKNKSFILNTQVTSLSQDQCDLLKNMTWLALYNCMYQSDQVHKENDSTQAGQDKSKSLSNMKENDSTQAGQDNSKSLSNMEVVGIIVGGLLILVIGAAVARGMMGEDDPNAPPTPRPK